MSASLPFTVMPCPCCGSMKIAISTTTNALTNLPRNDKPVCLECGVRAETLEAWNRRITPPEATRTEELPSGMASAMEDAPTIRDAIMRVMRDHYWDSLEPQKELVLKHIESAMRHLHLVQSPQVRREEP